MKFRWVIVHDLDLYGVWQNVMTVIKSPSYIWNQSLYFLILGSKGSKPFQRQMTWNTERNTDRGKKKERENIATQAHYLTYAVKNSFWTNLKSPSATIPLPLSSSHWQLTNFYYFGFSASLIPNSVLLNILNFSVINYFSLIKINFHHLVPQSLLFLHDSNTYFLSHPLDYNFYFEQYS